MGRFKYPHTLPYTMVKTSNNPKVFSKKCKYCGKEITSLYEKQAQYNVDSHELACKKNPKNKVGK